MNASDLDEVAPVIGYRATRILAAWFPGRKVHVPVRYAVGHPLELLLGRQAFEALIREFPGEKIRVPTREADDLCRRDRQIAEWLALQWTADRIAGELGLRVRRVEQIRARLVREGWLQYAQGFDTAKAHARRGVGPAPQILGTGEGSERSPGVSSGLGGLHQLRSSRGRPAAG